MTILQSICTNVAELLTSEEVLGECKRQPAVERTTFMTTFAVYVEWLVLHTCRPLFTSDDYSLIASEIRKQVATQHWFSIDLYSAIAPSVTQRLDNMAPGRHTGVVIPMVHAIERANACGHSIQHSTDPTFAICTLAAWKFIAEQIPKLKKGIKGTVLFT